VLLANLGLFPVLPGNTALCLCSPQCLRLLTHSFNNEYSQLCNSISDCKVSRTPSGRAVAPGRGAGPCVSSHAAAL
jgi:hypothetical protein